MQDRRELISTVPPEKTDLQRPFEPRLPLVAEPYSNYRGATEVEDSVRFADYWRAVRKRLWLVIGIVILMMTLTAIYMARRPDIFLAKSRVQVDLELNNPALESDSKRGLPVNNDPAYFNTQLQNLNSPGLLRRVVKEINLENNKDFLVNKAEESRSSFRSLLRIVGLGGDDKKKDAGDAVPVATSSSSSVAGEDIAEAKRLAPYVEALQKSLGVEPVRESRAIYKDTRLIDITYQHTNPELAALVVNTVADVFAKRNQEEKTGTNSKTNDYLKSRVAELQSDVKRDEEQLVKLKRDAGVIQLDADKTLALAQLSGLNEQYLKAQEARKIAEAQYNEAKKPEAIQLLMQGSAARKYIEDTSLDLAKLKQEREKLAIEFTDGAFEIKELDKQIASRERNLADYQKIQVTVFLQQLKTQYDTAVQQEQKIQASYNAAYSQAQVQNNSGIGIKLLEQRLNANKGTLDDLLKTQRGNDITAAGTENNVSVADVAIPPDEPIGPRRLMSVMLSGLLAGLFGCGLALFLEYLDDSIKTTDDVEKVLRLPALAAIPTIDSVPRRKLLVAGSNGGEDVAQRTNEVLITGDARSALAEAYRQLRTSILLSTAGHAPKSLLVTSSVPSEGKTTTAINTAISLAQTGAKVLIIDADMRRPRLHAIFSISNEHGLSSILASRLSEVEILNIIQQDTATSLYLLPSGAVPPNPAELIGSEQMQQLIQTLENTFTHVVIDSPPIASFTDGVLIATMVDGVLLVVHSGKSSRQIVKRAKQLLTDVGAKIFGVVLNNVNVRSQDNHYYYQSYYNSYYSDSEK
ncbi:MAG: polysaccharide biosynthesis tyrosine autokinase [Pyrinomonadaceae bacterium]